MKTTKKFLSILLAMMMALSLPLTVFADSTDANFTLSTDTTNLYAGMSYEVTAKITDLSQADYNAATGFSWAVDAPTASISSKNNYSTKSNGNNTYTVSETATFVMPNAGETLTITATLGSRSKTIQFASLTPITSYLPVFQNSDHAYFDETSNTLYLDRLKSATSADEFAGFSITEITPVTTDDSIVVTVGGLDSGKSTLEGLANNYTLKLDKDVTGKGTINFSTNSGSRPMSYNFQTCVPLTKYALSVTGYGESSAKKVLEISDENNVTATLSGVAGKPFTISKSSSTPSAANDYLDYELYTDKDLNNKASSKYFTATNNNCELNIDVAGTYYLVCKNYSMDNGKLVRDTLGKAIITLVISKAYPIESIQLFELDANNVKTDTVLEELTLYTNTAYTYSLANNVTFSPAANTDTLTYSSSNPAVAKVDATTGVITAVAKGTTTIWVRSTDNASALASVTVNVKVGVKAISSVVTADGTTDIPSGHIKQLRVVTNPTTADEPIYWSTSNPDILSINPTTGVALAKDVSEKTPVIVYATTESGISNNTPIYVVPSNKAESLTLNVTSESQTFSADTSTGYVTYSDYYLTKNQKSFTISAEAFGANGSQTNDEFIWTVTYDGGVGMTFEEAKSEGYLSYTKNTDSSYVVVPLKPEVYTITCTATTNISAPTAEDPTDTILIQLKQTASTMSVIDESTGKNAAGTIYIPIGKAVDITVKTSTVTNSKSEDPAMYSVLSGGDYVNIDENTSADGEGKTYTITGLSYGLEATKVKFSSASESKSTTITFYVRNNLNDATITGIPASVTYTGSAITFSDISVMMGGTTIDKSLYSIKYANNTNVGIATITITGTSGSDKPYSGSVRIITFEIKPLSVAEAALGNIADQRLSSSVRAVTPTPTVTVNNRNLSKDKDFTVSYSNNTMAGNATVTITGIGNYTGTVKKTFKVIDLADYFKISTIATQTYTGKAIQPAPTVTYNGKTLKKGTDYTLSYSNNVNAGIATVTVTGIGYYSGKKTATFTIKPKTGNITSLKAGKKSFTVKWSKQTDITGYQIQYATDKKFTKNKKTSKVTNIKTNSKTVKKLTAKKTYYVRVRTYKVVNGKTIYGSWSKVKSVKTKK